VGSGSGSLEDQLHRDDGQDSAACHGLPATRLDQSRSGSGVCLRGSGPKPVAVAVVRTPDGEKMAMTVSGAREGWGVGHTGEFPSVQLSASSRPEPRCLRLLIPKAAILGLLS
jgi:hypothetical protein